MNYPTCPRPGCGARMFLEKEDGDTFAWVDFPGHRIEVKKPPLPHPPNEKFRQQVQVRPTAERNKRVKAMFDRTVY